MARILKLNKHIAELIAAGEVVERPASALKELLENSIDSGASKITISIRYGGVGYIKVTDNGSGILKEDVRLAFLKNATSKLKNEEDLLNISTLGFRGEALASICAVSKVEIITKVKEELYGTHYKICGGEEIFLEEGSCPDGTTIIVKDLFYNVPARMKFLKSNIYEGNVISKIIEKLAVSNPNISFKFIKEKKEEFTSPGDGELESTICSVYGNKFFSTLIPLKNKEGSFEIFGYITRPEFSAASRNMQIFFINKRYIKSNIIRLALEEAYKGSTMVGKYPSCVVFLNIPFNAVDVNVHPAKTEVRFNNEKLIYDLVYYAAKNALFSLNSENIFKLEDNDSCENVKKEEIKFSKTLNSTLLKTKVEPLKKTTIQKVPDESGDYFSGTENINLKDTLNFNETDLNSNLPRNATNTEGAKDLLKETTTQKVPGKSSDYFFGTENINLKDNLNSNKKDLDANLPRNATNTEGEKDLLKETTTQKVPGESGDYFSGTENINLKDTLNSNKKDLNANLPKNATNTEGAKDLLKETTKQKVPGESSDYFFGTENINLKDNLNSNKKDLDANLPRNAKNTESEKDLLKETTTQRVLGESSDYFSGTENINLKDNLNSNKTDLNANLPRNATNTEGAKDLLKETTIQKVPGESSDGLSFTNFYTSSSTLTNEYFATDENFKEKENSNGKLAKVKNKEDNFNVAPKTFLEDGFKKSSLEIDEINKKFIGEAFKTYIILELNDSDLLFIDKHAAHERILYEKFKNQTHNEDAQSLIEPVTLYLSKEESSVVLSNKNLFLKFGFNIEDFGPGVILIRGVPLWAQKNEIKSIFLDLVNGLLENKNKVFSKKLDWIYKNMACRAAIKAKDFTKKEELLFLIQKIRENNIKYCPHGRPVYVIVKKLELEKRFFRV